MIQRILLLLCCLLSFGAVKAEPPQSCHLHAPSDIKSFSKQPLVLPAVGDANDCEQLNRERFGARGRCHCFSDDVGSVDRPVMPDYSDRNAPAGMLP
ncbi:MAG: hypothetical protein PVG66_14550 [Chromatiales bacterium]|jgi:hypothetical protein